VQKFVGISAKRATLPQFESAAQEYPPYSSFHPSAARKDEKRIVLYAFPAMPATGAYATTVSNLILTKRKEGRLMNSGTMKVYASV
jgi:glucan biosynthesis protein